MKKIAIFASGSGTNAQRIIEYFKDHPDISVSIVLCNKPDAFVLERAKNLSVDSMVFFRKEFYETDLVLQKLEDNKIDLIVLAGFLWLLPENLLNAYAGKIINIHPALLPKYGGKGMFGMRVHEAVIQAGEKESGISIHLVNEKYDAGEIIFQAKCVVSEKETPETLAKKIHLLEYTYFPKVIESVILNKDLISN
jgi:phosphoribosylglycinamide formyltransferase 1